MTAPSEPPLMHHDADGIREHDNQLPRWWVWLFILTTVWAFGYVIYFHVTRIGRSSVESYAAEMEAAGAALPDFDASALSPSTDPHVIGRGQALFLKNCVACHGPQGGGLIGPNLCDDAFIHGPTFADMLTTIREGVPAKGMITWKVVLPPAEIEALASYTWSLRGTTPATPKAPEGKRDVPAEAGAASTNALVAAPATPPDEPAATTPPAADVPPPDDTIPSEAALAGRPVYDQHCAACHGTTGDGNGPASIWLFPRPRNFSAGLFKIQSTPAGALPTDADLLQTVERGMPGSSMPSFAYLGERERHDVVQYVKFLTAMTNAEGRLVNAFAEAARRGPAAAPVEVPPEPTDWVASVALGKQLFTQTGCTVCHGETGAGNGLASAGLRDVQGIPVYARDFNTGAFRGGSTGRDLYLRIHNGLAGTPMPPYAEKALKPDARWALVHYIQSLRRKEIEINDLLASAQDEIRLHRVAAIPAHPSDPRWEAFDPARVPLNPLWPEPQPIPAVAVIAVHDGQTVAFHLTWRDPTVNGESVRVQEFQDEVAMQFAMDQTAPFLGMGDKDHPVNLWLWRASWQQEVEGKRPDQKDEYPSMHVDTYMDNLSTNDLYMTAVQAGNPIARQHASSVEDANARGFGTLTSQPVEQQNVGGRGIWFDGSWSVVLTRTLDSQEPGDVRFAPDRVVPVAFAVWDGEQRDRNGRKVISNWLKVVWEPEAQAAGKRAEKGAATTGGAL